MPAARKFGIPKWAGINNYKEGKVENEELRELPRKDRGKKTWVNYQQIAIGKGIVLANDWTLLKENGESLNLDFSWCQTDWLLSPKAQISRGVQYYTVSTTSLMKRKWLS